MSRVDVCIVGGGLLGTATAYFSALAGLKTLVLEERDLASGASGAAFGGISVGIYSYSSARVPASFVELSKASLALYHRLQDELGSPMDYLVDGSLDPYYDETGFESRRERALGLQACGVSCQLLSRKEVQEIEPAVSDVVAGATYCAADGHVTPPRVVWALAAAAKRHGAEIRTGARVEAIIREGNRVVGVQTADGNISAGWVVSTAGIGTAQLGSTANISIPVNGWRGQMFVTERIPPLLRTHIHNIKQTASGTIVFGATREPGVTEVSTTVAGTKEMVSRAMRLVPALAGIRVIRSWAGTRPVPPDGYPIIGPIDGVERLLVAVMHRGVTLAPIIGQVLVELILHGRSPLDISLYRLSRFANFSASQVGEAKETSYGPG